ncbi:cation efflux system protein CusA [mine drainage metagenome]|uniref:Cation efflux system protein CusA n=1 Tax=mine drainage metagenome TaxID=410659 RepID=A0A1J5RS04_9ZZZZ
MIRRIINWSIDNRLLVLVLALLLAIAGIRATLQMTLDAIPDLSDVQVIVKTPYPGQAPEIVEDQVTYPLTSALLSVPGSTAVRGFSMYGESYLYVLFKDGTDPYWARSRVLEYLDQAAARLPKAAIPTLGPDASGVGWIFEYALVDRGHRYDADQLRAVQDFFLKYELQSLPGVSEVATVGGMARQFQIEVDPVRLAAYKITLQQVAEAVRANNAAGGGAVVELGRAEFMVRSKNYLKDIDDMRAIPLTVDERGIPVRLQDVAHIGTGPEPRRGVTDLDGMGEAVGGIVVMRHNQNALETVNAVKQRLQEIRSGLPDGVELVVTYDRSGLILDAVHTLQGKLVEESVAVALVCLLFLFHLRSSLVAVVTLPLGILAAFIIMQAQGVTANVMSLGGIAIAIGTMVDAAIVMVENMHKHLERMGDAGDRWEAARQSALEVGPALFFSLAVITVSFLPVFTLTGQEGKLFAPLAYTKTYAMAAAAMLAVTLLPVLMGYFIREKIAGEQHNPLNRVLQAGYRPLLERVLGKRRLTLMLAGGLLVSALYPLSRIGSEFMPPLYEGDLLYMPTTLPGISLDEAANLLQITDRIIKSMPEVERVYGKAGRADTATDPAPLSMFETTILLKPKSLWPEGERIEDLVAKLDREVRLPGLTNSWGYPIRTRIDMLSTGIRTPLGIKITGPDLRGIAELGVAIEAALKKLPGTQDVFAERVIGGHYLDIQVNRWNAARYGVTVADVESLVQGAIGGEDVGTMISGRERFSINLRYPRELRDSLEKVAASRVTLPSGEQIPLHELARLSIQDGPAEIKSENARLAGYVYLNVAGRDLGGYVQEAREVIGKSVRIGPGYAIQWSGQYTNLEHARQRLYWLVPATILLVMSLLYLHFRQWDKVLLVLLCLPFSLIGGIWTVYLLGYQLSVAVAVGFIALAGVAAEFGIVMLLYLDRAIDALRESGRTIDSAALRDAVMGGAVMRLRPKMMTVSVIVAGLLPVMFSDAAGTDVMKRIAAPLVGGMLTAPLLSLIVVPLIYLGWQEKRLARIGRLN